MNTEEMTPMEAWRIISQCMDELVRLRQTAFQKSKAWTHIETEAQVIAFEALRRMEEDGDQE